MNIFRITAIILPVTFLLACGGGGGSAGAITPEPLPSLPVENAQRAISLVGGSEVMPTMTSMEIEQELRTRANAADRLTLGVADITGRQNVTCTGVICNGMITDGVNTYDVQYSLNNFGNTPEVNDEDLAGYNDRYSLVMADSGATLWQGQAAGRHREASLQFQSYGGWLDNSVFTIQSDTATDGIDTVTWIILYSFGNDSGNNPTGSGMLQWTGVMVGANTDGHVVHGDATIEYDPGTANVLDRVTFDNVKDLDDRSDVTFGRSGNSLGFQNIPLNNGVFRDEDDIIRGSFYGDNHEEVGGIFVSELIVGSFGATRVTE